MNKDVHVLASWALLYVGAEVAIGGLWWLFDHNGISDGATGWIVTYIIDVRGGGPSSGYISTGFFSGMQQSSLIIKL
jgi:hypothetical protein